MTLHDRFLKLIVDFAGPCPVGLSDTVENEFMLDADGPLRLLLDTDREEISFSTLIYCAGGEPEMIDPEAIAEFNAYHLFHGGYRLSFDPEAECLYISQTKALARIEATGLSSFIEDFIARCCSCTRWYMAEISDVEIAASEPVEAWMPA